MSAPRFEAGRQVGPYLIEAPLGAGGMGEVFRARDTRLRRTVAIKVLPHDKVADPERKKRFLQEARAASALNHPNIVTLYDIASEDGIDYLVMECVTGRSLDKLISPKGLPLAEAAGYGMQIAGALATAHAAGIVHRDIKPANVMVTPESQVKILDFGLAKLAEPSYASEGSTLTEESALTKPGAVMGTLAYMSPEQAAGKELDHRTDIFSLGVVLHEMIAGTRPFRGQSGVETLHAIIHDPAPRLTAQPPELQDILDKALAKDPRDRYQHAGDLMLDLRRFQRAWEAKTLISQASGPAARPKHRLGWAITLAAVLLGLTAALWVSRRGGPQPDVNPLQNAVFKRFTDFPGEETDASISPDGKFVAFRSDRDGRWDTWVSQVGTGRFTNLTKTQPEDLNVMGIRSQGFSPDGSEIWLAGYKTAQRLRLLPLTGGTPRAFLREGAVSVAWSPDGSRLVYHTKGGDPMFVADRNGANSKQIFTGGPGVHNHYPTWSPDGKWIYFVSGRVDARELDLWRIAPSGGNAERMTSHHTDVSSVAPLPSGAVLYISPDQDGSGPWLWALDPDSKVTRRVSFGLEHYTSVAASADGRRLVAAVSNPTASLWSVPILDRVAGDADVKPFPVPDSRALAPRFGGNSLFYLSSHGTGDGLWRFQDGRVFEIWKGAEGPLLSPAAISRDGRRAAVVLKKQGKLLLHLISTDGSEFQPLTGSIDVRGAACWSPDGKWIVTGGSDAAGEGLFKIPVEGGTPIRILSKAGFNPVWSPDGTLIVYNGPSVGNSSALLAVTPDGRSVALPAINIVRVFGFNVPLHAFLPSGMGFVYLPGTDPGQDFWLLDLASKKTRPLARLGNAVTMTFDISPDGKQIVFDRIRENSDIVLIDLPK